MLPVNKSFFVGLILATAWFGSTAAAAEPARFDVSSEEAMAESNRKVTEELPAERRKLLAEAIIKLGMVDGAQPYTLPDGTKQTGISPETIRKILHGKTAEEIISLAAKTESPVKSVEFKASK